jgi:hypothetical protein
LPNGIGSTENASPLEYWESVVNSMLLALPVFTLFVLLAVAGDVRRRVRSDGPRLQVADRLIVLTALAAAWSMARSAPLPVLTGLPVIGTALEGWASDRSRESSIGSRIGRVPGLGFAAVVFAVNVWLCGGVINGWYHRIFPSPIAPTPFGFDREARYHRLRNLAERHGLRGPVFTDYNLGSLVEYQLYPERGYVDNRPDRNGCGREMNMGSACG